MLRNANELKVVHPCSEMNCWSLSRSTRISDDGRVKTRFQFSFWTVRQEKVFKSFLLFLLAHHRINFWLHNFLCARHFDLRISAISSDFIPVQQKKSSWLRYSKPSGAFGYAVRHYLGGGVLESQSNVFQENNSNEWLLWILNARKRLIQCDFFQTPRKKISLCSHWELKKMSQIKIGRFFLQFYLVLLQG